MRKFKEGDLLEFDGSGCTEAQPGATAICKGYKVGCDGEEYVVVEWIKNNLSGDQNDGGYYEETFKKIKDMKTIAQQLNIKEFPFIIKDKSGNEIYYEDSVGFWYKYEYDSNNNEIYCEDKDGYWVKGEFDSNNNRIYFENSYGDVTDNRPKQIPEYTIEQLQEMVGKEFKIIKD